MPIPFLLAGLGVAAGVIGVGGHISAKDTNEKAQRISQEAQEMYNDTKYALERAQNKTEKALLNLGYLKKQVLESSMNQFLNSYDKIKHITIRESVGLDELSKFTIDQQDAIQLREMTDIYSSTIKSGATGAAAGAVVALAASGSLSVIGGEMAIAGSALAMGEVSAAAGIAGSALSFGAAMTPLAAVAAPVILFTGISASMKADENLEKANTMYAEAEAATEKMKVSITLCDVITDRSEMFSNLLSELNGMFSECSSLLAGVIKKREGKFFKKKITSSDLTQEELRLVSVTRALAGTVKAIIDTPIISKEGTISNECQDIYNMKVKELPILTQEVETVKQIDFKVRPIEAKETVSQNTTVTSKTGSGMAILREVRNLLAFGLGVYLANFLTPMLVDKFAYRTGKFLFLDLPIANSMAIWLIICTAVTMIIGKLKGTIRGKCCAYATGIGISILYGEYHRVIEMMDHYIIISIVVIFTIGTLATLIEKIKNSSSCGEYLYNICTSFFCYPFMFLIYAFFSRYLGFSDNTCFIVVWILASCGCLGVMS